MKPNSIKAAIAVDRLATPDEVLAADLPFADPIEQYGAELVTEIAADVGGYVRFSALDLETSLMVEELSRKQDTRSN
jgi:hypothetical protein